MNFNPQDIIPKPSNWFSSTIEYQGQAEIEVENPPGKAQGPIRFRFSEQGEILAQMVAQKYEAGPEIKRHGNSGMMMLLTGSTPEQGAGFVQWGIKTDPVFCKLRVTIETPYSGVLKIYGIIRCISNGVSPNVTFRFSGVEPEFEYIVDNAKPAKYWVLPLLNFYGDFGNPHYGARHLHPLRIYPTPELPDDLPEDQRLNAVLTAHHYNRFIYFEFENKPAFIEGLPGFDQLKEELVSGKEKTLITALMIGDIGSNTCEFEDVKRWLPIQLLYLLGVLTGAEIGSPWVEFRDEEGNLVKCIHAYFGSIPVFHRGHRVIWGSWNSVTEQLLQRYLKLIKDGELGSVDISA